MPFKQFNAGDVITASDLNAFMMNQQVMVFDSASARDTNLPAPVEGMVAYLKDTNTVVFYDGSGWGLV